MNKSNKILIFKGQLNSCPLLFIAALIFLVTVLPACSKKPSECESEDASEQIEIKKPHYKTFVNQAKNIDITTPVGFKLVKTDNNNEASFFVYQGKQGIEKVISFYVHELEIAGWDFRNLSTEQEGLFVCNNASKTCVISIRPQGSHTTTICITMATNNLSSLFQP